METENRCKFWLPKKKRFCANSPLGDSSFCGNHKPRSDGQWLLCPIDPSHSVLKENLEWHVKRCPLLKLSKSLTSQPFYKKAVNSGSEEGLGSDKDVITSEMKRNYVYGLSVVEFRKLIEKIESVHARLCEGIRESFKMPETCNMWIRREVDRELPFQGKHVVQQASILGNMEEVGLLKSWVGGEQCGREAGAYGGDEKNVVPAVVEFGAGRGYLTQMLADCYGINRVFLVERKSYKLKADRSLRRKESLVLVRLRIDIEDLNLNAVESLREVPYLAIGKHLCGPATDLTLRCCLSAQCKDNGEGCGNNFLEGLALATCCHHLCQWKHYINKRFIINLGMSKEEFHAITWFTSWAVDADHGSDILDLPNCSLPLKSMEEEQVVLSAISVEDVIRNMSASERAVFGFKCKQIIDVGRMIWAKEQGLDAQLVKYVPSSISPENHLLVARSLKSS